MKGVKSLCAVLLVCFAVTLMMMMKPCCAKASIKYQFPGSSYNVTILNYLKNAKLLVHCRSKDDDLKRQILNPGGQFEWNFKENFWQSTRYWCYFNSRRGHSTFEVFWPEKQTWLQERCDYRNCIWVAEEDGIYIINLRQDGFELIHKWEPAS